MRILFRVESALLSLKARLDRAIDGLQKRWEAR